MRMRSALTLLFFASMLAASVQAQTAFVNANVLTMTDDDVREGWTVVVDGSEIVASGPSSEVEVPASAARIDASGRFLIPGLAEMHGHIPPVEQEQYAENVLFLYVANGVTTVRGMQGSPGQLDLKTATREGSITGPNLYLAGPGFSGGSIDSPEQAARRVREQAEEGWDYIKVLGGLSRAEYDAMAAAADEAGIPIVGHVPGGVGIVHAIEAGQESIDHLQGYIAYVDGQDGTMDQDRLEEIIDLTIEHGTWLVPTMAMWETALNKPTLDEVTVYPELRFMPPEVVDGWVNFLESRRARPQFDQKAADAEAAARIDLLGAMNEAGARILLGTDAPQWFSVPGFSLQREIPFMLEAGMTPYEILVSGTRAVGEYTGGDEAFGTIAAGSRADLVLLNQNPLDDIMHVFDRAGVMTRGRWLPEAEIQMRLAEIEEMYD